MSNEHAATAVQLATQDIITALISALAESGQLSADSFKAHLATIQRIQQGNAKLNEDMYEKTISNAIAAVEGRVR